MWTRNSRGIEAWVGEARRDGRPGGVVSTGSTSRVARVVSKGSTGRTTAWSRQARPTGRPSGLDRLDRPGGRSGLDRLDQPGGRSGLDKLDQPGTEWSRRARPAGGGVVSTGSTSRWAEWSRQARPAAGRACQEATRASQRRVARGERSRTTARCRFSGRANRSGYSRRWPRCDLSAVSTPFAAESICRGTDGGRTTRTARTRARRLRLDLRGPPHRPPAEPPQRHGHRVVEPDDRVGTRPDEVPHGLLVAVGHPLLPRDRRTGPLAQDGQRRGAEARPEVQRVQLHVGYVDQAGQLAREGRLARTGPTEDQDPVAVLERRGRVTAGHRNTSSRGSACQ